MSDCVESTDSGATSDQLGGGGANPTSTLSGKAWQRTIREERAAHDLDANLFGRWWESVDTDIKKAVVREVDIPTARGIIETYEWMKCLPAVVWHCYGIYFDGHLGGVVTYGPEYSENLGKVARESGKAGADWSRYGFEGKMILLSRGACTHWAHPHAGSKLIRQSMRLLPKKYEIVTATTDPAAGEVGTIYQACGFTYVGSMRQGNPNVKFKARDRHAWRIAGKLIGPRAMRQRIGSTRWEEVQRYYPDAVPVMEYSKHRYFAFRGTHQRDHAAAIADKVKPYPKREVGSP
jgi:hypothetical protein